MNRLRIFLVAIFTLTCLSIYGDDNLNYLKGNFNPAKDARFAQIPKKYASASGQYLRKEALEAFGRMAQDLKKEGFNLYVVSSTRNFEHQKRIWTAKFSGKTLVGGKNLALTEKDHLARSRKILRYSSMPGTSRHHWGTDFDLGYNRNAGVSMLTNAAYEKGDGLRFYKWMLENAHNYGFCQPYRENPQTRAQGKYKEGYQEEKWHWSFRPVSAELLAEYEKMADKLIPAGFQGDKAAATVFRDYVSNVHASCR